MRRLIILLSLFLLISPIMAYTPHDSVEDMQGSNIFTDLVDGFVSWLFGSSDEEVIPIVENSTINNTLVEKREFKEYDYATQSKELIDLLKEKTESELVSYSIHTSGNNDITTKLYAPDKIYGYSAFPTKLSISKSTGDTVHVERVKIWVASKANPNIKYYLFDKQYEQTYNETEHSYDSEYTISGTDSVDTIMKAPDNWSSIVKSYTSSSNVDYSQIENILHSDVEPFEVYYQIDAHIERYITHIETDENGEEHEVKERDDSDVQHLGNTVGLDSRIKNGDYMIGSFNEGSLPIDYIEEYGDKLIPYESVCQGSTSNILSLLWSSPVNAVNRSPDMKYVYIDNCGELFTRAGVPCRIYDDVAVVTLQENTNHNIEVSSKKALQKGYFTSIDPMSIYTSYTTDNEDDLLSFNTYAIVYGEIERKDSVNLPVWTINKPEIFVYGSERTVSGQILDEIKDLQNLTEWNYATKVNVLKKLNATKEGLNTKIITAKAYKGKAKIAGSSQGASCADKAIAQYQKAIDKIDTYYLEFEKLLTSNDKSNREREISALLETVRVYEIAGDEYTRASKLYTYGKDDQAESVAEGAEDLVKEPTVPFFGDGGVIDSVNTGIANIVQNIPFGEQLNNLIQNIPFGYVGILSLGLIIILYQNRSSLTSKYRRYKRRY
ncbi:hypothetical protein J3E07_000763 [Methanococcus voltae]|uniref:Uncharacterized protein n=1 Tax=Methanococcus voltae TaxID=2188 RepID=A0A8J7RM31_METVO|nr:hypothetical protein [Methanococcus voltae]MBP2201351.1 hypothetical protein [Methanococcus voltae]